MPPDPEARATVRVAIVVGVVAAIIAAYARYESPLRPGVTSPRGFYGYNDQRLYLGMARIVAHLHLPDRVHYPYGLGYPVLGAVFFRLGFRGDPFAPVDVLSFGATIGMTVVLAARTASVFVREHALLLGVAAAGLLLVGTGILSIAAIPWNSNIVMALGVLVLVLVTSARPISRVRAAMIGLSLGWIFATRYADAFFFGLPVLAVFVVLRPHDRRRLLVIGGATAAVVVGAVLFTQYHAFGNPFTTPYSRHRYPGLGSNQSLSNYRLGSVPSHFWGRFVTGRIGSVRQGLPILRVFPLLPLAPIGMVLLVRATRDRVHIVWMTAAIASVASTIFYLSFVAGGAGDIRYGNERYWAVWYPFWSVLVVICIAISVPYIASGVRAPRAMIRFSARPRRNSARSTGASDLPALGRE